MIWLGIGIVAFLAIVAWVAYEVKHAPMADDGVIQKSQAAS